MSDTAGHLSIGEVLSLVQEEFPDVTISKIRFLEGQGLIDPERTPSGYRKFYEPDIVRLRWILRQQRDHFLPLKVIKAKLEQSPSLDFDDDSPAQANLWSETADGGDASVPPTDVPSTVPATSEPDAASPAPAKAAAASKAAAPSKTASTRKKAPDPGTASPASAKDPADSAAWLAALQEAPKRHVSTGNLGRRTSTSSPSSDAAVPSGDEPRPTEAADGPAADAAIRFGIAEVVELASVSIEAIDELIEYGLVAPEMVGGEATFDATSVEVVRACIRFSGYGVRGRHLRIYKNAADREAGFYEQLILPLLKQRNPKSRERAAESLGELVDAGEALHHALVRQALRQHL